MCVIAFHWRPHGPVPLLLAGNRDEFYERPTAPLAWWEGGRILAGRDVRAGGTWLGLSRQGRFAALTNHRDPALTRADRASRGELPVRFLEGAGSAATFLGQVREEASRYNPFNLLVFDGVELLGYESRRDRVVPFAPGIHGVSNGAFDEPWPKLEALKAGLAAGDDDAALLALLAEDRPFPDDRLPATGVPLDWERALSPVFVRTPGYGTRASTILRLGRASAAVLERRHAAEGPQGQTAFRFPIP